MQNDNGPFGAWGNGANNVAHQQQNLPAHNHSGSPYKNYETNQKDPHKHWEGRNDSSSSQSNSIFKDFMLHWPVQALERQLQFLASSKADLVSDTNSIITDFDFRWLGIRNLKTVSFSLVSLVAGLFAFVVISLFTKNILLAYLVLFAMLSHSFFAGYIIFRMRKFILGPSKTKRYADIVRKSWVTFEFIYFSLLFGVFLLQGLFDWVSAKKYILTFIESKKVLKRVFFKAIEGLPIDKMDFILGHLLNGLLIMAIFYVLMVVLVSKKAKAESLKLQRAVDKEHLRPAEIIKKNIRGGKD